MNKQLFGLVLVAALFLGETALVGQPFSQPSSSTNTMLGSLPAPVRQAISLADLRRKVVRHNESIQSRVLDYAAQRRRHAAEYGVFEPELTGSAGHEVNNRKNTAEQQVSLLTPSFHETNNIYSSGLETLVPSGARFRLGYNLRDLDNNLQPLRAATNGEYQSFFGISASQPLLKNFGTAATLAGIRLAAVSNKMVFQEYRRGMMSVVSAAEASYWNLYLAQEQVRFFQESVKTAGAILKDNRTRFEAGKGAELEILEAEAGLALRQAKLQEAEQKVLETGNRLVSLYAEEAPAEGALIHASDLPRIRPKMPDIYSLQQTAFNLNPDYLIAEERVQQELVRLGYARNQRLPELDLKGSYGMNGLGRTPADSWGEIERQDEPSWFVGAEFRLPLTGGIRGRNFLVAARLQLQSSELALHGLEIELANGMNSAWHKIQSTKGNLDRYETSVRYNRNLLDSALTRLEAGKLESRKVFEVEADYFQAKFAVVESLVRHEFAWMELEMLQGVLLQNRQLEITQGELQLAARSFGSSRHVGDAAFQQGLTAKDAVHERAVVPESSDATPEERAMRQAVRDKSRELEIGSEGRNGRVGPGPSAAARGKFDEKIVAPPSAPTVDYDQLRQKAREKDADVH